MSGERQLRPMPIMMLCELFGHWPSLFRLWRRQGRWTSRCWLCDSPLVLEHGDWEGDPRHGEKLPRAEREK